MADCSPNLEEKAEWDHLARHWLSEAIEIVETKGDAPNGKVKVEAGEAGFSVAQSRRKT